MNCGRLHLRSVSRQGSDNCSPSNKGHSFRWLYHEAMVPRLSHLLLNSTQPLTTLEYSLRLLLSSITLAMVAVYAGRFWAGSFSRNSTQGIQWPEETLITLIPYGPAPTLPIFRGWTREWPVCPGAARVLVWPLLRRIVNVRFHRGVLLRSPVMTSVTPYRPHRQEKQGPEWEDCSVNAIRFEVPHWSHREPPPATRQFCLP